MKPPFPAGSYDFYVLVEGVVGVSWDYVVFKTQVYDGDKQRWVRFHDPFVGSLIAQICRERSPCDQGGWGLTLSELRAHMNGLRIDLAEATPVLDRIEKRRSR